MVVIKPITLDEGELTADSRGQYKVLDDFVVAIDGRKNLEKAIISARLLVQDPHFQCVSVIRDSQTLEKSTDRLFDSFFSQKFHQNKRGIVLPWPERQKTLKFLGVSSLFPNQKQFTALGNFRSSRLLGPDYRDAFNHISRIFPEYLSWDLRFGINQNPGGLHFDKSYEKAEHNIMDRKQLPKAYKKDVQNRTFEPLEGSITITLAVRGGGTIVVKCDHNNLPEQHFDEYGQDGRQTQDGDLTFARGNDWPNPLQLAAYHCAPLHNHGRDVAVLSSYASYLAPQVLDVYGPDELKSEL